MGEEMGPEGHGIVAANYGKQVDVLTGDGAIVVCELASDLGLKPVAGDRVRFEREGEIAYLTELLPRAHVIRRAGWRESDERILAAHVDCMLIVSAVEPRFKEGLVDRYLVTAGHADIAPVVVLNKVDLDDGSTRRRAELYSDLGYPLYCVSALEGEGIDALADHIAGRTSILVGHSGVGKSSLLMALVPGIDTAISEVSTATGKGVHTTTTSRMWSGPGGVRIIDSPGIRAFGLSAIDSSEVATYFVEFTAHAAHCRFRDCMHLKDAGCAVRAAVESEKIPRIRYDSYVRIVKSLS